MLEILLIPDRAAFSGEISEQLPIGQEAVRKRMRELETKGYVEIKNVSKTNIYRLTEHGYGHLSEALRDAIQ